MAQQRKKWQLRYRTTARTENYPSETKTYERIRELAKAYADSGGRGDPRVYVWHTEGVDRDGQPRWVRYEDVDLAELAAIQAATKGE